MLRWNLLALSAGFFAIGLQFLVTAWLKPELNFADLKDWSMRILIIIPLGAGLFFLIPGLSY